jgi:hypothetical protein
MAQDPHNTAERELLRLIEGKSDTPATAPSGMRPAAGKRPTAPADAGALLKNIVQSLLENLKQTDMKEFFTTFGPRQINAILLGIMIVLGIVYLAVFVKGFERMKELPRFTIPPVKSSARGITLPLKEYSYYYDRITGRNMFIPFAAKKGAEMSVIPKISEATKDLKLVGISWSDVPAERFAIIEDVPSKVTYFLKEGETLSKSDVMIKGIQKEKVVLDCEGEETDLR